MKILLLVTNDIINDSRVKRVASSLASFGADLTVFARRSEYAPDEETCGGYRIRRVIGPYYKKKRKKSNLDKVPVLSWFFEARKKIDKYKINISGFKIKFKKINDNDYNGMFEINKEAEKKHIEEVLENNKIFVMEALKVKPDVVYCNDLDTLISGVELKNKTGCRVIYDAHELFSEQFTNKSDEWKEYFFELEKTLIGFADGVITVNESIGKELVKRYNIKDYTVVANCARYKSINLRPSKKEKTILYHGRFEINRGIEELVEAMRYIEGAKLILRGDGFIKDRLADIIKEHKLDKKVIFKNMLPVDKVIEESAKADIGVIAYVPNCLNNYFCTPNKLFEYIMAGLAVCGSDLPELNNYIIGGGIGEVFDPRKPRSIADSINKILGNENILKRCRDNVRVLAKEKINWEIQEKKLKEILMLGDI
ncbi:MAG: glycosyltransferase [Armatimonadota bacterium]